MFEKGYAVDCETDPEDLIQEGPEVFPKKQQQQQQEHPQESHRRPFP